MLRKIKRIKTFLSKNKSINNVFTTALTGNVNVLSQGYISEYACNVVYEKSLGRSHCKGLK